MKTETVVALLEICDRISFMFYEKSEEYDDGLRGSGSIEAWENISYRQALLDVKDMIKTFLSNEGE